MYRKKQVQKRRQEVVTKNKNSRVSNKLLVIFQSIARIQNALRFSKIAKGKHDFEVVLRENKQVS